MEEKKLSMRKISSFIQNLCIVKWEKKFIFNEYSFLAGGNFDNFMRPLIKFNFLKLGSLVSPYANFIILSHFTLFFFFLHYPNTFWLTEENILKITFSKCIKYENCRRWGDVFIFFMKAHGWMDEQNSDGCLQSIGVLHP